jgi:DNA invertase Pin-like site-specific DNA recombinase
MSVGYVAYLKGMMSEMEVTTFHQRSQDAVRQMARRGEYFVRIPEGYVLHGKGRLEKDPDEQVRRSIELILEKFRALGSACQVSMWLRQEEIRLPKRVSPKGNKSNLFPRPPGVWRDLWKTRHMRVPMPMVVRDAR